VTWVPHFLDRSRAVGPRTTREGHEPCGAAARTCPTQRFLATFDLDANGVVVDDLPPSGRLADRSAADHSGSPKTERDVIRLAVRAVSTG
jgi:hypothetical protein